VARLEFEAQLPARQQQQVVALIRQRAALRQREVALIR
jgi:hypothetical protein